MRLCEIEHQGPLPRDQEDMNPHKILEDPPRRWVLHRLLFGWERWRRDPSAWRMRYSNAAYTSKHTVITLKSAMIRSGFLRERGGQKRGALRTQTPRSARAWPL